MDQLRAMGDAIRHRGPDDAGIFSSPGCALGNQRLSVIDVDGGHQPFVSDDGLVAVVQNGEIYNFIELAAELRRQGYMCRTRSDTEVLLRLYESEGIGFLSKLNGMFAIAILDLREGALYLVRDRIGVKPLYFHYDGAQLTFASEIKAILSSGIPKPAMDAIALSHYLTFNYVPAPHTLYQGVKHVLPGHYLRVSRDSLQEHRWWNLADVQPVHGRCTNEWIEEFNEILSDAVRLRLRSDVPFGAFLSGGVDSSSIVGMMSRHMSEPVKTFCIGFDDSRYDESKFAHAAAVRFGAQHTCEIVNPDMLDLWPLATYHCDQPHGDVSFLPTLRLSQLAVQNVKVVLTGDGGDELFAGYDKYQSFFARNDSQDLDDESFQRAYFDSISLFSPEAKHAVCSEEMRSRVVGVDSFELARTYLAQVPHQDRVNQALYLDVQMLLCGNNLVKPDRMGMAVSLEARTPFLDYRMMEFAFRMPGELKLFHGETKYLYKKAVAPMIGEELAYRRKQMFTVPIGEWLRTTKLEYCRARIEMLLNHASLFAPEAVRGMVELHRSGIRNFTRELRALISISHWLEIP